MTLQHVCPACGHVETLTIYVDNKPMPAAATAPTPSGAVDPQNHVPAAHEVFGGDVAPPKCPTHRFEMKHNSRGWYCSGKTDGKWCTYRVAG